MKTIKLKRPGDIPAVTAPSAQAPAVEEKGTMTTAVAPVRRRSVGEAIFVAFAIVAVLSLLVLIGLTVAESAFYQQAPSVWP